MTNSRQSVLGREDLLIPEARRSLEGFVASLRQRGDGQLQASLHAKDLAVALMSVGQAGPSEIFSELSRQLALRNPGVLEVAERFATTIGDLLSAISSGEKTPDDARKDDWSGWFGELRGGSSTEALIGSFGDLRPKPLLPETAEVAVDTPKDRIRLKALSLLQEARRLNFKDDERTVLRLDAVLSELQDWMLRPLQNRITDIFSPIVIEGGDIGIDPAQAALLKEMDTAVRRARERRATYRSLLVFLDLKGLVLNAYEQAAAADVAARLGGRVQSIEEGYRLVLPSSKERQRVTPFLSNGKAWVIANSRLLSFHPAVLGSSPGQLETMLGRDESTIAVERVMPSENMNLQPLPEGLAVPHGVTQIAVHGRDEAFLVWPSFT